ncbi:hypothetical protein Vadar_006870 [Vaccinium darrowii]|uniref:Uncharacterized protein n=1 Tax=Vaccinium darrowii TaxID=229202 RepID=A0ACB7XYS0_9ERIC|nr:hypothetical protein Vadar_006870 [Vaccinium darrowii]
MSTTPIHVQEKRKRPIINGDPHPTPLRIKEGSHVIKKVPLFSSHNKTRVPKRYPGKPSSPMVIHTNPDDFKALVQRLTGLSQPDQGSSLPPYTYADPMSFSPLPNMESLISPIQDEFLLPIGDEFIQEEFLDIETLLGF